MLPARIPSLRKSQVHCKRFLGGSAPPSGIFSFCGGFSLGNEKIPGGGTDPPRNLFQRTWDFLNLGILAGNKDVRIPEGGTHFSHGNGIPRRDPTKRSLAGWVTSPRHLLQWAWDSLRRTQQGMKRFLQGGSVPHPGIFSFPAVFSSGNEKIPGGGTDPPPGFFFLGFP